MSLSKENYDKLNERYLYQKDPDNCNYPCGAFWCKNWTFKVHKFNNGKANMYDTYFDNWDNPIEVNDDNINDFKVVFDFRDVKRISDSEYDEYDVTDLYRVATDSGGYSCGNLYWVRKDAVKSLDLLIVKKQREINIIKSSLKKAKDELKLLLSKK